MRADSREGISLAGRDALPPSASRLAARLCAGIVVIIGIAVMLAMLLVLRQARMAVLNETTAAFAYAGGALDRELASPSLNRARIQEWAQALERLRHVCVVVGPGSPNHCASTASPAPAWFVRALSPAPRALSRSLDDGTRITLAIRPGDELGEAWTDVRGVLAMIVAAGGAILLLVYVTLWRGLVPVDAVLHALRRAGEGRYEDRLEPRGPRELRKLATGINALTDSLARGDAENRLLLKRCLQAQEDERKLIARELHDDIGQYLSALEADLAVATRCAAGPDRSGIAEPLQAARTSVRHVFHSVRGLLDRLRPAALDELGLAAALIQLGQDWQRRLPDTRLRMRVDESVQVTSATTAMHLYRIAQEGLTNAARHAAASEILISFGWNENRSCLRLRVADDGCGFRPTGFKPGPSMKLRTGPSMELRTGPSMELRTGLGLRGMRERAESLGARLELSSAPDRGCRIELLLPA